MTEPSIDQQSDAVAEMAREWPLIDALIGGTSAMRAAGKQFLPQFPKETTENYRTRLSQAVLFPAFSRTASALAAKPLSRPISITGLPARAEKNLGDIDRMGTPMQALAASIMRAVMAHGVDGVLVDAPIIPGLRTIADEDAAGARPYMARYPASSILGWDAAPSSNGPILTQLRLLEQAKEPDGPWAKKLIPQVRVLTPGAWQIWRKVNVNGREQWALHAEGATSLDVIPFVFFYGLKEDFGIGKPPLLDLAYLNVEHWQSSSDQQHILHVARVPILFAKGFGPDDEITIGASTAATTANADAELKYVEHTGEAIGAGRQSLLDLEDRMRQIGAELLVQRPSITTATQIKAEAEANRSTLQEIVENFEDSLEACLRLMSAWVGEKNADPKVALFKDFGSANLSEKTGDLLLRAAKDGHVSTETTLKQLKRADIIPADTDIAEEQKRLAAEGGQPGAAGDSQ